VSRLRSSITGGAGWWICLLVLIVTGWPALLAGDHEFIVSFTDDTFYYLVVARHVARGDGFTFDGLHPTNGFQPLWLFALVPIFWLVPGEVPPLRALIAVQSILFGVGALLLWKILRSRLPPASAAAVPLLLIGLPGTSALWLGMESALFFVLLIATWAAWLRLETRGTTSPADWALLGGCCALLFLARLEGGAALPVVLLLAYRRIRSAPRPLAALASLLAPAAIVWSAYLTWNIFAFGTWLPISGVVKTLWVSRQTLSERLLSLIDFPWAGGFLLERAFTGRLAAFAMVVSWLLFFGAAAAALYYRKAVMRAVREADALFVVLTCAIIALVDHVVVGAYLAEWALIPIQLLTAMAIGLAAGRVRHAGAAVLVIALLLSAARIPAHARKAERWDHSFTGRSLILAEWIRDHTPPGARVATVFAGVLGYFSGRTVINLDGLVNSVDYYERVLRGDEWESYLSAEGIDHLAHVGCADREPVLRMLDYFGKQSSDIGQYALAHLERDPSQPEGCGLLLFTVDWNRDGA
jgi:hypothetical protein